MPPKNANMQKITAICENLAKKLNYELCDAAMEKEPTGRYLRIYIDTESGVTLDDCEKFHRAVQPMLEPFDYDFLEVCSPGIERELVRDAHFEQFIGADVMVKMLRPIEGVGREFDGVLKAYDSGTVTIEDHGGENELSFNKKEAAWIKLDDFD